MQVEFNLERARIDPNFEPTSNPTASILPSKWNIVGRVLFTPAMIDKELR
jgi:hypothetical protein